MKRRMTELHFFSSNSTANFKSRNNFILDEKINQQVINHLKIVINDFHVCQLEVKKCVFLVGKILQSQT